MIVLHIVADARRTRFSVVVRIGEATEGVLYPSMTLYEEHNCDAEGDNNDKREEEQPRTPRGALSLRRKSVGLNLEDLRVTDV